MLSLEGVMVDGLHSAAAVLDLVLLHCMTMIVEIVAQ